MDSRFAANSLTPGRIKRLKTLIKLFAKSKLSHHASIRIVHDYSQYEWGRDYVFEVLEDGNRGCMRGYGGNVQAGDRLILQNGSETMQYQIDEIEHYSEPANLWIALVHTYAGTASDPRFWMGPADRTAEAALQA
jgi:hypothetical protein